MPRRSPRPYATLTRQAILDAARVHLESGDVRSMTIRKLASDLDVSPMALYRHVQNKDDVLLALTDLFLADRGLPSPSLGWRRYLEELAESLRSLLHEQPALVGVFNRQPVTTPAATARLRGAREILMRAGFSETAAVEAYAAVHTYTIGFCLLDAGRGEFVATAEVDHDPEASAITRFVSSRQYRTGLRLLLAGLEQQRSKAVAAKPRSRRTRGLEAADAGS